jgi:hypothetical protein
MCELNRVIARKGEGVEMCKGWVRNSVYRREGHKCKKSMKERKKGWQGIQIVRNPFTLNFSGCFIVSD